MITEKILDYIKQQLDAGVEKERIKKSLFGAGWQEKDIEEAFRKTQISSFTPIETFSEDTNGFQLYAGFWRRLAASFVDSFVIFIITVVIVVILIFFDKATGTSFGDVYAQWSSFLIFWLYYSLMESSSKQATVGKMVLGIKVTDINGNRLSFGRATGRTFAKIISMLTLGIGFLMAGFTKKKQGLHDIIAGCLVVKYKKSHFLLALLAIFLSFALFFLGIGTYIYFVKWPQWKQSFFTRMEVISEPTTVSDIDPLPEKTVQLPKNPLNLTEAEYDELLTQKITGFESTAFKGSTTNVGSAILELSDFWEPAFKGWSPNVWIETRMIPLPNLNLGSQDAKIIIDHVLDKNGNDIYNPDDSFEQDNDFGFSEREMPVLHLHGLRSVHLKENTTEGDIKRVEGKFILRLPLYIQTLTFTSQDVGKEKSIGESKFTLTAIDKSQVLMNYKGQGGIYYVSRAYNEKGEELESDMKITGFHDEERQWNQDFKDLYKGDIKTVKIITASKIVEREYPFVLEK